MDITVKGIWPILKYTIRGPHGQYAVIFIDDDYGNIVIQHDLHAYHHWWGRNGRGKDKLREFLVGASFGYLQDKFSYNLNRWCSEEAVKNLRVQLEEKFGHPDDWPESFEEMIEEMESLRDEDHNLFYCKLMDNPDYTDAFDVSEMPSGELYGNKRVTYFLENYWPHIEKHWMKELEDEKEAAERSAMSKVSVEEESGSAQD